MLRASFPLSGTVVSLADLPRRGRGREQGEQGGVAEAGQLAFVFPQFHQESHELRRWGAPIFVQTLLCGLLRPRERPFSL